MRDLRGGLDPDNHTDLKHFPAQRATILREGNIEYWYCSGCGKYYKDAKATIEITQEDTVIPKVKRDNSGIPSHGGETGKTDKNDKTVQSVKTGDAGVALYGAMALLSLTGGRERLVRSRHLAHGAAAESVRVFAEDFHSLLYGVDEAGLSDGCEMLLLSTMNGETRVGPLYNFSGYEIGEGNG